MTDTPIHPPCAGCGGPVLRRAGERPSDWLGRRTCSTICSQRAMVAATKAAAVLRGEPDPKPCQACGAMMVRGRAESRERFAGRSACSRECQGKVQTLRAYGKLERPVSEPKPRLVKPVAPALRPCVCCGNPIPWPPGLTAGAYHGKSTCGADACKNGQQGRPAASRLAAEIVSPPSSLYRPNERQRREWRLATPAERRLFAPEIRAALGEANA